jgi:hypothetical protein
MAHWEGSSDDWKYNNDKDYCMNFFFETERERLCLVTTPKYCLYLWFDGVINCTVRQLFPCKPQFISEGERTFDAYLEKGLECKLEDYC